MKQPSASLAPATALALLGLGALVAACRGRAPAAGGDLLRHRFSPEQTRYYRCEQVAIQQVVEPEPEGGFKARGPEERQELVMVERETCYGVAPDGTADVAYQGLSMEIRTLRDGEQVYSARIDPSRTTAEAAAARWNGMDGLPWMLEEVRYRLDPEMRVHSVHLPDSVLIRHGRDSDPRTSYREALEARYRSFFPAVPVLPGDTWGGAIPVRSGLWETVQEIDPQYGLEVRHAGYETVRGLRCVVLEGTVRVSGEGEETLVQANTWNRVYARGFRARMRVLFALEEGFPVSERSTIELILRKHEPGVDGSEGRNVFIRARQEIGLTWIDPPAVEPEQG